MHTQNNNLFSIKPNSASISANTVLTRKLEMISLIFLGAISNSVFADPDVIVSEWLLWLSMA